MEMQQLAVFAGFGADQGMPVNVHIQLQKPEADETHSRSTI